MHDSRQFILHCFSLPYKGRRTIQKLCKNHIGVGKNRVLELYQVSIAYQWKTLYCSFIDVLFLCCVVCNFVFLLCDSSRVQFMLEIIANIRNNNLRKIPGYDPSEVNHLRKLLGSIVRNTGKASHCLVYICFTCFFAISMFEEGHLA